jgi:hypothetical protein
MGGHGSGRRPTYGKSDTDDATPLDILKLVRSGLLVPGRSFLWQWTRGGREVAAIEIRLAEQTVKLCYRKRSTGEAIEQGVHLASTPCRFGGKRTWFTCPQCARRVAVLYCPGKYFACRTCCELGYPSQKEDVGDRAMRQADKIRKRLGWPAGFAHGLGSKPKGMHWRTYHRLMVEYNRLVMISCEDIARKLGFLHRLMDG